MKYARHFASGLVAASILIPASGLAAFGQQTPAPVVTIGTPQDAEPVVEEPQPPQPPIWSVANAEALLSYIDNVGVEGLIPADYDPDGLRAALAGGDPLALAKAATDRFNLLSSDLALGHVRGKDRIDWHIDDPDLDEDRQRGLLDWALYMNNVGETLDGLLPTHPQYAALKHALEVADPADAKTIEKIRLNMDRWRWLPRNLGQRYIIVNVPAYTAALVENGETISRHRAVAGAIKTPTPQLMATATGVIFNPYWNVPKSIEPEVANKPGYEAVRREDGSINYWRQPPGKSNALGRIKFVMYNPHAIYLHDTNARGLFDTKARAYSHGCIRTENILGLANLLLEHGGSDWTAQKTIDTVNSGETKQANFTDPLPVYIVYFSTAAKTDGSLIDYQDIYKRDTPVLAALNDHKPQTAPAAATAKKDGVDDLAPLPEA